MSTCVIACDLWDCVCNCVHVSVFMCISVYVCVGDGLLVCCLGDSGATPLRSGMCVCGYVYDCRGQGGDISQKLFSCVCVVVF